MAAAYVFVGHRAWLTVPGKNGKPHQPNTMRDVEQRAMRYCRERWDLLELPAESVPCWLPDWVFDWAEQVGLPTGTLASSSLPTG